MFAVTNNQATVPAAVLFDLDGTLLDSIELIVRSFQHVTEVHLGHTLPRARIVPTIGRPLPAVLEELAPGRGRELLATFEQFLRAHHDRLTSLFPGTAATLSELGRRGYRCGIVTSKRRKVATLAWDRFQLGEICEVMICLEDVAHGKPAPDPLLAGAAALDMPPDACLYVGDSTHDILSARAAGMTSAAALWGPSTRAELEPLGPTWLLETITDVLTLCPARAGDPVGERPG